MVLVTMGLTIILWLTQSLRFIELTVNKGASIGTFLKLTLLVMPQFLNVILPVALFTVSLFTFNKLITDRELVVMRAAGMSHMALAKPALLLAIINILLGLLLNLWLVPRAAESFHKLQYKLRSTATGVLLQEGQFTQIGKGLTVYVRARNPDGELLGLIIHDRKDPKRVVTTFAERGALIKGVNDTPAVMMFNATRESVIPGSMRASFLLFENYTMEFSDSSESDEDRVRDAHERSTRELFSVSAQDVGAVEYRQFRVEGHQRLSSPLYHLAFASLAAACLLCGWFNRRGQFGRVVVAIGVMLLMQALALGANSLAIRNLAWIPLMYLVPVTGSVIGIWLLSAPVLPFSGRRS